MLAILITAVVVIVLLAGLLLLRSRGGRKEPALPSDPHTHARDTTDPARGIDQLRSQGNAGGTGGAF